MDPYVKGLLETREGITPMIRGIQQAKRLKEAWDTTNAVLDLIELAYRNGWNDCHRHLQWKENHGGV